MNIGHLLFYFPVTSSHIDVVAAVLICGIAGWTAILALIDYTCRHRAE